MPDDAGTPLSYWVCPAARGSKSTVAVAHVQELENCFRFEIHVCIGGQDVSVVVVHWFFWVELELVQSVAPGQTSKLRA